MHPPHLPPLLAPGTVETLWVAGLSVRDGRGKPRRETAGTSARMFTARRALACKRDGGITAITAAASAKPGPGNGVGAVKAVMVSWFRLQDGG